ncbi:MAG: hypothetical protein RLZZ103_1522 [Pseudomonadota bacterium]|jgi:hypothetical protein
MRKIMLFASCTALALTACGRSVLDAVADVKTTGKSA